MPDSSPTVRRRRLAYELRRLREKKGLTIDQVAAALECSDSKISRIETARVGATPRDVRDMIALYEVNAEERDTLMRIAREARQKGWWHAFRGEAPALVGLESAATAMYMYTALLIPGLLQTERYARAVLKEVASDVGKDGIDEKVMLRMARQDRLSVDGAPSFTVVIDEAVLQRSIGGREVMREQLERLVEAADLPNVTLLVLPFSAGEHAGVDGSFTIIDFSDPADSDVVYLEGRFNDAYVSHTENPIAIGYYKTTFRRLQAAALRPAASKSFFVTRAKELQ